MRLFGTDGIRGVVNEELTAEIAFRLGNAVGKYISNRVFIAKDTRASGDMLEAALIAGATSAGATVYRCGVLPTPALAIITKLEDAVGIMISASHNPPEFNGLKVISRGFKLPDEVEENLEKRMKELHYANYNEIGCVIDYKLAFEEYTNYVLEQFADLDLSGMKILVDAGNGAAYETTPYALKKLGAKVDVINNSPDGYNINVNCGSTEPNAAREKMTNHNLAILHDGDADRCILLDEKKNEVHGDRIMGISALLMKEEGRLKNDTVVGTVLSNKGLEVFLKERGINLLRAKVGDRYVLEKMQEVGAVIGGERSGHIIYLDKSTTGDGLITALEVLRTMVRADKPLSELSESIPDYPQIMINVKCKNKLIVEKPEIRELVEKYKREDTDIVVRPSGTEPLARVFVQGPDEEYISNVAYEIAGKIEELSKEEEGEK
ncbi:MAG: phosphoglucosamine mutase [Fervidobacterium sp.]|uniref:Phosphoglucosamine mutase n=1 Tax=Fervidobacterium gondwanense DSM 13020 TaxID=1121883 RepID=A0A1M7T8V5_FERGO|nr:phosphoglucosamine mutase [Fervidobacterium gondwanense]SHN67112.1 phosphoglucosamine mutase [Fervidobacterium gondwanense DSM 13020]